MERGSIDKRAQLPENIEKKAEVDFVKNGNKYVIKISDQGNGFFWQKYMNADHSRALESNGRGIARANIIFSKLELIKKEIKF